MRGSRAGDDPMSAWLDADWPAPPGVRALTTTRFGMGVSQPPFDGFDLGLRNGDDVAAVAENRMQLESALQLPSSPRWLRQVHGTTVAIEPGEDEPEADAAVTSAPGTVLAILTADCLPVVFAARDGSEVAAAHAGWGGLARGMLEKHTLEDGQELTIPGIVPKLSRSPGATQWLGPDLGAHTDSILQELGMAPERRQALREQGIVE